MGAKKFSHTHRSTMCGFEEISFRGFPGKLKSVGRMVAAAETAAAEMAAETDQKQ